VPLQAVEARDPCLRMRDQRNADSTACAGGFSQWASRRTNGKPLGAAAPSS
jgi:hypothetical protein